jgi:cell division protein ZapA (FtsZ GTPase activity inhibitor)
VNGKVKNLARAKAALASMTMMTARANPATERVRMMMMTTTTTRANTERVTIMMAIMMTAAMLERTTTVISKVMRETCAVFWSNFE